MELNKLDRQLRLMTLLVENTSLTVAQVAARLDITPRSVYRYIDLFRQTGFIVAHERDIYRIDKNSPFFKSITGNIMFSEDEAITVAQLLYSVSDNSTQIKNLRAKLDRLYNYGVLETHDADRQLANNTSTLYEAVKQHRIAVLKDYRSHHGESVSDRIVEPYQFLNANDDIRCYEIATGLNKTFKISRIGEVRLIDLTWSNADKHDSLFTDIFGFSGKPVDDISLLLSPRAAGLLCEDFPAARAFMGESSGGMRRISVKVCSYLGPMRFVFGLYSDVTVEGSTRFIAFLREKAKDLTLKFTD